MLGAKLNAPDYLRRLNHELDRIDTSAMQRWADLLYAAWRDDRAVFVIGNGGSGTTASHFAEDLGKSTLREADLHDEAKNRLRVMSLTDNTGWIMAVGNDVGYEHIFVLTGSQVDENSKAETGTLIINPPGTHHSILSENGCIVLAIYEKPVKFLAAAEP